MRLVACFVLAACASHSTVPPSDDEATEATDDDPEDPSDQLPAVTVTAAGHGAELVAEAERELSAMRTSHYEHHTRVDEASGRFDYDCSGFVGYALAHVAPAALQIIPKHRPLAKDFEAAFTAPPAGWSAIGTAGEIQPGDIIAWLEPADIVSRNTGHVMIVERAPHPSTRPNELVIGVIDSSHSWHGHGDTRHAERHDGLGRGEIVLVLDRSGRAIAYRWSNSKKSSVHQTSIAIGRLR